MPPNGRGGLLRGAPALTSSLVPFPIPVHSRATQLILFQGCRGGGVLARGGYQTRNPVKLSTILGSKWTAHERTFGWRHFRVLNRKNEGDKVVFVEARCYRAQGQCPGSAYAVRRCPQRSRELKQAPLSIVRLQKHGPVHSLHTRILCLSAGAPLPRCCFRSADASDVRRRGPILGQPPEPSRQGPLELRLGARLGQREKQSGLSHLRPSIASSRLANVLRPLLTVMAVRGGTG